MEKIKRRYEVQKGGRSRPEENRRIQKNIEGEDKARKGKNQNIRKKKKR